VAQETLTETYESLRHGEDVTEWMKLV